MNRVQYELDGTTRALREARQGIAAANDRGTEVALVGVVRTPRFDVPQPGLGDRLVRFLNVKAQVLSLVGEARELGVPVAWAVPGHALEAERLEERVAVPAAA